MGIMRRTGPARCAVISMRFHIRPGTGKQQSVQALDDLPGKFDIAESGYHQRDAVGDIAQSVDIFAGHPVGGFAVEFDPTGGNPDDGRLSHGV